MAQHNTEYKLDFTTLMLRNDLPNYRQVLSAYTQTIPGAPMNVCFYPKRAGIFVVKTNSDKDAQKLENSTLIYSYGKKNEKQVKSLRKCLSLNFTVTQNGLQWTGSKIQGLGLQKTKCLTTL